MKKINLKGIPDTAHSYESASAKRLGDVLNTEIKFFSGGLSDKKKESFYNELSILLSAGVDIKSSLELIEEEQAKEKDKMVFCKIKESVINGASFSSSLEQTKLFSPYEYYSIKIGEESGKLNQVLVELAYFHFKKIKQKRQLASVMSYPLIVFVAAFGALFFMLKFVVPMFSDLFKRFKGELPYLTKITIDLSKAFSHYSWLIVSFLLVSILIIYTQRNSIWFRKYGAKLVLRIPIMKDLVAKIYLTRFCQSMHLLISAKTPLVQAIELVKKMVDFYPIESSLDEVQKNILKGKALYDSLSEYEIYNRRMISLIKVAEEVNQLDIMFDRIAKQYSDEVEYKTSILGSLIEPFMILFLGVLVALILVAMYLPLFQMGSAIGN